MKLFNVWRFFNVSFKMYSANSKSCKYVHYCLKIDIFKDAQLKSKPKVPLDSWMNNQPKTTVFRTIKAAASINEKYFWENYV